MDLHRCDNTGGGRGRASLPISQQRSRFHRRFASGLRSDAERVVIIARDYRCAAKSPGDSERVTVQSHWDAVERQSGLKDLWNWRRRDFDSDDHFPEMLQLLLRELMISHKMFNQ